jgi:hypothetical protein
MLPYSALFNPVKTWGNMIISVETRLTNFRPTQSSVISIALAAPLLNPGSVALELRRLALQVCHLRA